MKNYLLPILAILGLLAGFYFLSDHEDSDAELSYEETIKQRRLKLDYFMRNGEGSPFASNLESFSELKYFAPDPAYRVEARFSPATSMSAISIATTDGKERRYLPYGYLDFTIDNKPNRLTVYQTADFGRRELFLGFADNTSANETYGGGRYIDFVHNGEENLIIDFNLAYNPYCVYNPDFVCPIPPRENILDVAIRAGEMNYK